MKLLNVFQTFASNFRKCNCKDKKIINKLECKKAIKKANKLMNKWKIVNKKIRNRT